MTKKLLVLLAALLVLSACARPKDAQDITSGVRRWHDDELNVTCWIYSDLISIQAGAGGISCIPDSQLDKGE